MKEIIEFYEKLLIYEFAKKDAETLAERFEILERLKWELKRAGQDPNVKIEVLNEKVQNVTDLEEMIEKTLTGRIDMLKAVFEKIR